MTDEQWEAVYLECCKRDFAKRIYEQCDREDREENNGK